MTSRLSMIAGAISMLILMRGEAFSDTLKDRLTTGRVFCVLGVDNFVFHKDGTIYQFDSDDLKSRLHPIKASTVEWSDGSVAFDWDNGRTKIYFNDKGKITIEQEGESTQCDEHK